MKNHLDPQELAEHCEDYAISLIHDVLRNQAQGIMPNHDSDLSEVVNQAFGYLITNIYKDEIS